MTTTFTRSALTVNPEAPRLSHVFEQEAAHFARAIAMSDRDSVVKRFQQVAEYMKDFAVYYAGPAKTPEGYASGSFGPTTAVTPRLNVSFVRCANDLKPCSSRDSRNMERDESDQ